MRVGWNATRPDAVSFELVPHNGRTLRESSELAVATSGASSHKPGLSGPWCQTLLHSLGELQVYNTRSACISDKRLIK